MRIESLLQHWHQSPDLLFSVHPVIFLSHAMLQHFANSDPSETKKTLDLETCTTIYENFKRKTSLYVSKLNMNFFIQMCGYFLYKLMVRFGKFSGPQGWSH